MNYRRFGRRLDRLDGGRGLTEADEELASLLASGMSAEQAHAWVTMGADEQVEASQWRVANLYGAIGRPYVPRALRMPDSAA